MKRITRVALAAAGLVTAGATALAPLAASASTHTARPNATTTCDNNPPGQQCANISTLFYDQNNAPAMIQNATGQGASQPSGQGRKINLRQKSDTRPNEDWIVRKVGTVDQLCPNLNPGAPLGGANSLDPTSYACLNYGGNNFPVIQAQFAPNGQETGQCAGAISASEGFKVRLERCGNGHTTFWVVDLLGGITVTVPGPLNVQFYAPVEFAADTSASNPLVLTLNPNTTRPANQLRLQQENRSGGHAIDRQMWTVSGPSGFTFGPFN